MTWAPERFSSVQLSRSTPLQLLRSLGSGPRGLVESEAEKRLARYGENVLPTRRVPSLPIIFLRSLRDPFTAVLACLALVSAAVAAWATAAVIAVLVVVSCALRAAGEHRADRSAAGLRELVASTATVLRRSDESAAPVAREIPVDQVVPGDVVRLAPGDLVPADLRLLRATGLTMHQAALTGESAPVSKYPVDEPVRAGGARASGSPADFDAPTAWPVSEPAHPASESAAHPVGGPAGPADVPVSYSASALSSRPSVASREQPLGARDFDRPEVCFQGSSVASGSGTGVVIATGADTRFATGDKLPGNDQRTTAFDRSVYGISWILIRFMLLTPPLVLMANAALRGRGLETLPFAVAVAVGLTPEMLPVIVTITLARGASALARTHQVIVKRLPALHDLGAVDVVCLDKTGTLTQDRPVLDCALDTSGTPDDSVLHWAAVNSLWTLQLAELPMSDALDAALLDAAEERFPEGLDALEYDALTALPFDPVRRLSTAVVRSPHALGRHTLVVKGGVEDVLERCVLGADERERAAALADRLAADGLRVLAVALADRPATTRPYTTADERGLTLLGLVGLRDATAETAAEALAALIRSGVAVKVLTGDHPGTAARACRELGLPPGEVVTAASLDALTDAEAGELAAGSTVFARCSPEHKARIVRVLRERGHVTGFLGDGVNDLPALRASDVGICPPDAVDVARESADVVLAAKDLTSLDHAIMAGRSSGAVIAGYLRITLSSNLGNVIAMLTAGLLLPFLPMLPSQVLVQNLCFDAAQLAFAYDRPRAGALRRPLKLRPREVLASVTGFGVVNAAADLATFAVLVWAVSSTRAEPAFHAGWFTENLLTQALVMVLLRTGRGGGVPVTAGLLALTGLLLPLSPLGPLIGMAALPPAYYPLLALVLALYAAALYWFARHDHAAEDDDSVGDGLSASDDHSIGDDGSVGSAHGSEHPRTAA
ncbi:magnesium-translocating P-type ATPase [Streptomyces sp. NBC_01431]|uniref:magnesium-translocating P-type ATPase n=1 Tax=Streptomyces sp. NBC_01431 TaxID=2903863 RepID=UPI002E2EA479|nr:magnesium-translocating P-type ATPase [Streptomyces sp. NBC_01431]